MSQSLALQLRPYQQAAIDAVYRHLRQRDDNPVIVLPTAAGKTPCLATICRDAVERWHGRVLVLSHVKELLEQAVAKLRIVAPDLPVGIYSAGLQRRDTLQPIIVAGIQSVFRRAVELGAFDLVIIDECHLLAPEGEGMYRQFLADAKTLNPALRIIGLTATPFRLDCGPLCGAEYLLNTVCFEVGIKELIRDGYLCPLVGKAAIAKPETDGLHVRGGEFVADEVEALMDDGALVQAACAEIIERTHDRHSCLIFASSVKHGQHVVRVLAERHGLECGFVSGETPAKERELLLARFSGEQTSHLFGAQPLKYLCNVNVLTTGFDAPRIDCVVLLRPTMSAGLWLQMVGRGFRLHPDKQNCLILDFGGNLLRHGPVDQVQPHERHGKGSGAAPAKECPGCQLVVAAGYSICPECGYEFPPAERQAHDAQASGAGVLSGEVTLTQYPVKDVIFSVHTKRDAKEGDPRSMRVDYDVGWHQYKSEWICFEHQGYARQKAEAWWQARSPDPAPDTAEQAVELAQNGAIATTLSITVRAVAGEPFERITGYELGQQPEAIEAATRETPHDDDIPF